MTDQIGGSPAGGDVPAVPNHLILSIVSAVCCGCLPLGVVAIIFSTQVNTHLAQGNIVAAEAASKKAKMFALIAMACGALVIAGSVAISLIPVLMNNR